MSSSATFKNSSLQTGRVSNVSKLSKTSRLDREVVRSIVSVLMILCFVIFVAHSVVAPANPAFEDPLLPPLPTIPTITDLPSVAPPVVHNVFILVDPNVNMTFYFNYSHTAPTPLSCSVIVDGGAPINQTTYRTPPKRVLLSSISPGPHVLNVSCFNSSLYISSKASFSVDAPPPPPLPVVTITLGSAVNTSFNVTYSHNASTSLNCSLSLDDAEPRSVMLAKNALRKEQFLNVSVGDGHSVVIDCVNASMDEPIHAEKTFSVLPEPARVVVVYPIRNVLRTFNVTFYHTDDSDSTCTTYFDNAIVDEQDALATEVQYTAMVRNAVAGLHALRVTCWNDAWNSSTGLDVEVFNTTAEMPDPSSLMIQPYKAHPADVVTINGNLTKNKYTNVSIKNPWNAVVSFGFITSSTGVMSYSYIVPSNAGVGKYYVTVTQDGGMQRNGSFYVEALNPTLSISGNRTNVTAGTAFSVLGDQFLPYDIVLVTTAGVTTISENYTTDADGSFVVMYPGNLTPRTYAVNAVSKNFSAIKATFNFVVVADSVVNTTPKSVCVIDGVTYLADAKNLFDQCQYCNPTTSSTSWTPVTTGSCWVAPPTDNKTGAGNNDLGGGLDDGGAAGGSGGDVGGGLGDGSGGSDSGNGDGGTVDGTGTTLSTGSSWRWIIVLVVFLVVILGTGGFFVYNGTLDISSLDAFKESVATMFGAKPPMHMQQMSQGGNFVEGINLGGAGAGSTDVDDSDAATLRNYITTERAKGFDDLTIRGKVIANGWDKDDVDKIFDQMYRTP